MVEFFSLVCFHSRTFLFSPLAKWLFSSSCRSFIACFVNLFCCNLPCLPCFSWHWLHELKSIVTFLPLSPCSCFAGSRCTNWFNHSWKRRVYYQVSIQHRKRLSANYSSLLWMLSMACFHCLWLLLCWKLSFIGSSVIDFCTLWFTFVNVFQLCFLFLPQYSFIIPIGQYPFG